MQIKDKLLLPFVDWLVQLQAHHSRRGVVDGDKVVHTCNPIFKTPLVSPLQRFTTVQTTFISHLKGKFGGVIIQMEAFFSISKHPPIRSQPLRCHDRTTKSVCEVCDLDMR